MSQSEIQDKRLLQRQYLRGELAADQLERILKREPDLAQNAEHPSAEEVEAFRESLEAERTARNERIERFLNEPPEPEPPPVPIVPIDSEL